MIVMAQETSALTGDQFVDKEILELLMHFVELV